MDFLTTFECKKCCRSFAPNFGVLQCPCGGPLYIRYDLEGIARRISRSDFQRRQPGMWRYRELLPLRDGVMPVSLGEGGSPLIRLDALGARLGLASLFLKEEGSQPTLTFKARGASLGVSVARSLGFTEAAMATTGSAGTAWAAYGARAGLSVHLAMPADVPPGVRAEAQALGADVLMVDGTIVEAGLVIEKLVAEHRCYNAEAFREPCRLEGKKSLGFEVAEDLGWRLPDVVLFPTGGGLGPLGMAKAFEELLGLGWVAGPWPRFILVQAAGCAPIVKAVQEGSDHAERWRHPRTIAKGIRVPETAGDFLLLDLVRSTSGTAVAVSDEEIITAQALLSRSEGISPCAEGAAALAALQNLITADWIDRSATVVLVNTGSGLKAGTALA